MAKTLALGPDNSRNSLKTLNAVGSNPTTHLPPVGVHRLPGSGPGRRRPPQPHLVWCASATAWPRLVA